MSHTRWAANVCARMGSGISVGLHFGPSAFFLVMGLAQELPERKGRAKKMAQELPERKGRAKFCGYWVTSRALMIS